MRFISRAGRVVLAAAAGIVLGLAGHIAHTQASVVAAPGGYEVSYSADVHTLYGSPITSVVVVESDGSQFNLDANFSPISNGVFTLSHIIPFVPTSALVFGIDVSPTGARPHLVTFEDPGFAKTAVGRRFDATFGLSENIFLAAVPAAASGDLSAQQTLLGFFTGPGASATFNPDGQFLVLEHTVAVVVSPEPATLAVFSAALVGTAAVRRRRGYTCSKSVVTA